ncbi:MAG: TatD family hydrolase [Spirochaetaceae bacterium]
MAGKKNPRERVYAYNRVLPGMTDSHFHSEVMKEKAAGLEATFELLSAGSASWLIDISIVPGSVQERRNLCAPYPRVRFTSGIHPGSTAKAPLVEMLADMDRELTEADVVGAGEMGLDWVRMYAPPALQEEAFRAQIDLANRHGKPIIIHNRGADEDIYRVLKELPSVAGGIMHCFSSGPASAERALELGMHISFAGNVTYPSGSEAVQEACRLVPADRLLLETDAPFLAPQQVRGRPNSPAYVGHTYEFVAALRQVPVAELTTRIGENLERLFRL